jgi:hypothetical protein
MLAPVTPTRYEVACCSLSSTTWLQWYGVFTWRDSSGVQCERRVDLAPAGVYASFSEECPAIYTNFVIHSRDGAEIGRGVADWQSADGFYYASIAIP